MTRFLRSIDDAEAGLYRTPRSASGISATMISALKMIAEVIADFGLYRCKMFSLPSAGITAENMAGMIAKYLATFSAVIPALGKLNILHLYSPKSAITSAIIFNALIIVALIPLALRGVRYKPSSAQSMLRRNLVIYGIGGLIIPFVGIWAIDLIVQLIPGFGR